MRVNAGELSKAFVRMDSRYGGIGLGVKYCQPHYTVASRAVFPAKPARDFRHAGRVRLKKDQNVANQI